MTEFLLAALTFPAVVFTTLLGICLGYWSLVIVGVFGPESLDGVVDGVLDGAIEGTAALSAPREAQPPSTELAPLAPKRGALARLELRSVPVTVSASIFCLFGWALTHTTALLGAATLDVLLARWLWGSAVLVLAVPISLRLTSWAIRPLALLFANGEQQGNDELIGQIARVQTIRVTRKVGQASVATAGGSVLVTIRADETLGLTKNDHVMLVSYDPEQRAFEVTRIDDMLPSQANPQA
jgi:hypothetical protein